MPGPYPSARLLGLGPSNFAKYQSCEKPKKDIKINRTWIHMCYISCNRLCRALFTYLDIENQS